MAFETNMLKTAREKMMLGANPTNVTKMQGQVAGNANPTNGAAGALREDYVRGVDNVRGVGSNDSNLGLATTQQPANNNVPGTRVNLSGNFGNPPGQMPGGQNGLQIGNTSLVERSSQLMTSRMGFNPAQLNKNQNDAEVGEQDYRGNVGYNAKLRKPQYGY